MPLPADVVQQWIQDTQALSLAVYELHERCQRLVAKTTALQLDQEAAPTGFDGSIEDVRTLYLNVIKDMTNFVQSGGVGKADRSTMIWKVARRQSV